MFINNGATFRLDPATTPSIKWGYLVPSSDFADAVLASAAIGTLYVSVDADETDSCSTSPPTSSSVWQKVGAAKTGSSASDWQRLTASFSWGTTPPNGQSDPWCGMGVGDFYIHTGPSCSDIWVKSGANCVDGDWTNLTATGSCVTVGYGCPDGTSLADQSVGSYYLDSRSESHIIYIKLTDDGDDSDWYATNTLALLHLEDKSEAEACLPVGIIVVETGLDCPVSWLKTSNTGDESVDFIALADICVLTGPLPPDPTALNIYPNGTLFHQVPPADDPSLWVKLYGNGDAGDWMLVTPEIAIDTITVATGASRPDGAALSTAIIGSIYLQQPAGWGQVATWFKVYDNGDDDDWQIVNESPIVQEAQDLTPADWAAYPIGTVHINSATNRMEMMTSNVVAASSWITVRPDKIKQEASGTDVNEALLTNQVSVVVFPNSATLLTLSPQPTQDVFLTFSAHLSMENQYQGTSAPTWGNWLDLGLGMFIDGVLSGGDFGFTWQQKWGFREKGKLVSLTAHGSIPGGTATLQLGYSCTPDAGPGIDTGLLLRSWDVQVWWDLWETY